MSIICQSFEETIWEHARTGARLSAQAQAHIERCENCAQALREAKRIMNAVLSADCVPYAPDCRQAVMARIAPPARRPRFAWAYAGAGLVFAGISALAIVNMFTLTAPTKPIAKATAPQLAAKPAIEQPSDNLTREVVKPYAPTFKIKNSKSFRIPVVHNMPKRTNDAPYMVAKSSVSPSALTVEVRTSDYSVAAPGTAGHTMHFSTGAGTSRSASVSSLPSASIAVAKGDYNFNEADGFTAIKDKAIGADYAVIDRTADSMVASGGAAEGALDLKSSLHYAAPAKPIVGRIRSRADITTERPVAIAVVHWSTPVEEDPGNSYSYNYTDKDTETGEVTNCSVKRTGDTVEIRLESEPELKDPSKRGSIYYEKSTEV
ncbi:MAG: hypothetical protein NT018_10805 [Armatimonadetes bacterium]|nr:hypothetical protein [Armatimonadota bacterium]